MVIFLMYLKKRYRLSINWLINPKTPLKSSTPLSLIATVYGKKKVLDILYRFKAGDFS
ncbi:antitoxin Xre/MbcA/ParS toxin-binding domain-containing protein [Thalassotalea sp. SU-HH00458]|uniref:antitoxin Xre/MbcA/ParS toxin-binding domain-containing protein n=1 Tax=Thalassotalea sp. SU-HH00458 TaxID=3127657 RepID=UPI0033659158